MPTIITHAIVGAAIARVGPPSVSPARLAFVLAVLSVFPDVDVIGFQFGVPYSHWLGHRGLTHSLLFALLVGAAVTRFEFRPLARHSRDEWHLFALCVVATASHGLLDGLTDGGLGIAYFLPFSSARYFFPVQPIAVSPIGLQNFLDGPALAVLASEVFYVWIPLAVALVMVRLWSRANDRLRS
jgi:inner membrane protein